MMTSALTIPNRWDEVQISQQIAHSKGQPQMLAHYIENIRARFILKVEDRTARARTHFLRTRIEQLQLGKDYQSLINDLRAMEAEQENRLLRLDLEKRELESRLDQVEALEALRLRKEKLELEVGIAELRVKKEIVLTRPPIEESRLSPEQQRAKDKTACEARLLKLKAEKQNALKLDDEQERILKVNAVDDALQREMERWAKLL